MVSCTFEHPVITWCSFTELRERHISESQGQTDSQGGAWRSGVGELGGREANSVGPSLST